MDESVPYSKLKGVVSDDIHELAVREDKLVRPTLGDMAKDTLQGDAPALNSATVNEEHSPRENEEGKHSATSVNVNTDKASLNLGEEHEYVYGIDDGLETGIAVVDVEQMRVVFKGIIHLRNDVKRLMTYRKEHRRSRRNRLRYRKSRFDNRRRKSGWIPPSVKVKRDNIVRIVKELTKDFPPSKIVYEENSFDIKKLMFPDIEGKEYQMNLWYALLYRAGNKCEVCVKEGKLKMHHIVPLSDGGTNQVTNILIVDKKCHEKIHRGLIEVNSAQNIVVPSVNYGKSYLKDELSKIASLEIVYGYQTRIWREKMELEKNHWNDAIAMATKGERIVDKTSVKYCLAKRRRLYRCGWALGIESVMGFERGDVVRYSYVDGTSFVGCITSLYEWGACKIGVWDGSGSFSRKGPCPLTRCESLSSGGIVII